MGSWMPRPGCWGPMASESRHPENRQKGWSLLVVASRVTRAKVARCCGEGRGCRLVGGIRVEGCDWGRTGRKLRKAIVHTEGQ